MKRPYVFLLITFMVAVSVLFGGWLVASQGSTGLPVVGLLDRGQPATESSAEIRTTSPDSGMTDEAPAPPDRSVEPPTTMMPTPSPAATSTPGIDLAKVQPNELGTVPIIEYHIISDENGRWSRSRETFRQDLERWYNAGFRTISMSDYLDNRIDLPPGLSPLVITFDDSSPGQLTFIKEGDTLKPDPNCAVAIMEDFAREHPDFGLNAMFFVLPAADPPHDLFGQKEYQKQKLEYIVQKGMEIGNHTFWHQILVDLDDEEVVRQIGQANKIITDFVPGYRVRAFALPLGEWPPNRSLVTSGVWEGVSYQHDAVFLAGAQPAPAPTRNDYDPLAIPRVQIIDETMEYWMEELQSNKDRRYVSDGDPNTITFPERLSSLLNPAAAAGKKVVKY